MMAGRDILADLEAALAGVDVPGPKSLSPRTPPPVQNRLRPHIPSFDPLSPMSEVLAAHRRDPDRLPWPKDWFEGTSVAHAQRCRAMWSSALLARLGDLARRIVKVGPERCDISWIGTLDFMLLCDMAGLNGPAVADRCRALFQTSEGAEMFLNRMVRHDENRGGAT